MASSGKVTGVHIALIVFVMLTLISLVAAIMMYRSYDEVVVELEKSKSDLSSQQAASRTRLEDITAMKQFLGAEQDEVGRPEQNNPATAIGFTLSQMNQLAGAGVQPTVLATMQRMRGELDAANRRIAELDATNQKLQARVLALDGKYTAEAQQFDQQRAAAESDRSERVSELTDTIKSMQGQIDAEAQRREQTEIELERTRESYDEKVEDLETQIARLTETNEKLVEEIEGSRTYSFDVPDGRIVNLDYATHKVWISLGKEDNLPRGTTFSVYEKNLTHVGGEPSEIKATIQVTTLLEPHLAEATITWDDPSRPISRGDAIFTPLWRVGQKDIFALVGTFDLDRDGTDDREILKTIIRNAGGDVLTEVTPDGNRSGEGLNYQYKFLVKGDIGDPSATPDEKERKEISQVHRHVEDLEKEAKQAGVRVVAMNDFLSYIGYRPQKKLWRPGEDIPWIFKTDGSGEKRTTRATGEVPGAKSRSRRAGAGY